MNMYLFFVFGIIVRVCIIFVQSMRFFSLFVLCPSENTFIYVYVYMFWLFLFHCFSPIIMVNSAVIRFDYRFGYGQSSSTAMADTTSALFSLTDWLTNWLIGLTNPGYKYYAFFSLTRLWCNGDAVWCSVYCNMVWCDIYGSDWVV